MIQGIELLKQYHPTEIIPVAVERHVSVRLLQRCPLPLMPAPLSLPPVQGQISG